MRLNMQGYMCPHQGRQTTNSFASSTYSICVRAGSHYSLLTNAIHTQQIYGTTAIKRGRNIVWKAIITVEGGRSRSKQAPMQNNKFSLPGLGVLEYSHSSLTLIVSVGPKSKNLQQLYIICMSSTGQLLHALCLQQLTKHIDTWSLQRLLDKFTNSWAFRCLCQE